MLGPAAGLLGRRRIRVGVTGLARAGKTAFLTSVAANLRALGNGRAALPAVSEMLAGRSLRIAPAPSGASDVPRFDIDRHLAALVADPPRWPDRTDAVSLLALELEIGRAALGGALPPRKVRLEFLDYPGEWLLDLPLLRTDFATWSETTLRRLEAAPPAMVRDFLAFARGLPARSPEHEALAATGHRLYRAALQRLRDEAHLSYLQPGRFLMPPPGAEPPWMQFFPLPGSGGLAALMRHRYEAYCDTVRRELAAPMFGDLDRLVVLADLLSALAAGREAFADAAAALEAAAGALRWRWDWGEALSALLQLRLPPRAIGRVAFAATKADHVAARQRGNLAALARRLTGVPEGAASASAAFAIASVRCTEDFVWSLDGRPVSAVRGRVLGEGSMTRSYPGEVPDAAPDDAFWAHPFLALPQFEPIRPLENGRGGVPQLGLDALLGFLLQDVLA
jgi:uncharacterized protein